MDARHVALIYARLSQRDKDDISTSRQIALCKQLAEKNGWTVEVFEEGEGHRSGRYEKSRPQWKQLKLRLIQPDVVAVIVADVSRASRSVRDLLNFVSLCHEHEVQFISVAEPHLSTNDPMGAMLTTIQAAVNQYLPDRLSKQQSENAKFMQSRGAWWGGKTMPGLKAVGRGLERHLELSDENYEVNGVTHAYIDTIIEWFKMYTADEPIGAPTGAEKLNNMGLRWRDNGGNPRLIESWDLVLLNQKVARYRGFIDDTLVDAALKRYSERKNKKQNGRHPKTPPPILWGLVFCIDCGKPYVVARKHQGSHPIYPNSIDYRHSYGHCQSYRSIVAHDLESQVFEKLEEIRSLSDEQKLKIAEAATSEKPALDQSKRERLVAKEQRVISLYEDGVYDRATYLSKHQSIQLELSTIPVSKKTNTRTASEYLKEVNEVVKIVYAAKKMDTYAVNRLLRRIFKRILARKGKVIKYEFTDEWESWFPNDRQP